METWRTFAGGIGVLLVLIYAIGSSFWVGNSSNWYYSLNRPFWQPPSWIFGIIWPYNFIALGITSFFVARRLSKNFVIAWLILFALSVLAAIL